MATQATEDRPPRQAASGYRAPRRTRIASVTGKSELALLLGTIACAALIPVKVTTAYSGLPAHPLVLHVPVILIPVLIAGVLARVVLPRRVERFELALGWLAVVALASTVLTAGTGEALRHALRLDSGQSSELARLIARHAHAAAILRALMFGLTAVLVLDLAISRGRSVAGGRPRSGAGEEARSGAAAQGSLAGGRPTWPERLRNAAWTGEARAVLLVWLSLATGYFLFHTGDLGARAVWAGRLSTGGSTPAASAAVTNSPGARLFESSGCASCHALAAIGASGNVGANLDSLRPDAGTVALLVRNGGGGMPSFAGTLASSQIQIIAHFVASVAGVYGSSVPVFKPNGTTLADCARSNTFACYEQAFGNLTYRLGPKRALALYAQDINRISTVSIDCHRIGHAMGSAALVRFRGDVGEAMAQGSALCGSGYYHGIMERALYGTKLQQLGPVARRLCSNSTVSSTPFLDYQCLHGLGHGLMIYTGDDLPLSLRTCDQLSTDWAQISCTGGVFMENFTTFYKTRTHWVSSKDLFYPCDAVTVRYKYFCYDLVTARILPQLHWNWSRTAAECWHAERAWVAICFRSFGRDAWSTNGPSATAALRLCRLAGSMQRECDFSAALQIANDTAKLAPAAAFCNRTPLTIQSYCFRGMGVTASVLDPKVPMLFHVCQLYAGRYAGSCLAGAELGALPPGVANAPPTGKIFTRA